MKVTLLGQGYEATSENSVGNYLIKFLSRKDFHTFTGISAFASEAGVLGLSEYITNAKKFFKSLNLIVGVDQEGTSKEALLEINNLKINSYIFHQKESPIFHPKIYLFEGATEIKLIVGSSNFTATGLFQNVESSLLVEFSNDDIDGNKLLSELKEYFKGLFEFNDPNLFNITPEIIEDFIAKGIVPNETTRFKKYSKRITDREEKKESDLEIPKRATARIPRSFRGKPKGNRIVSKIIKELEIEDTNQIEPGSLVWTRKKLPASSVQIGGQATTNPTGGLRLVQDNFIVDGKIIDQTTYFRQQIFGNYQWKQIRENPFVEAAIVRFDITVKGKHLGKYNLEVRHKPSGEAQQGNYTTSISWGELNETIKNENLTNSRLDLYAPKENSSIFKIAIS